MTVKQAGRLWEGQLRQPSKIHGSNSLNLPLTKERTDNPSCNPEVKTLRIQGAHPIHPSLCQGQTQLHESMKGINNRSRNVKFSG